MNSKRNTLSVGVVIPCFKVRNFILNVISHIGPEVSAIYVVDDCCPEETGKHVEEECTDKRVTVLKHQRNLGVGGATITGYKQALGDGVDIIVKIDGDGQMDPALIHKFLSPISDGEADYTKGNRFYYLEGLSKMPSVRILGNAILSFI
jgi:dolichol-phosphate mannosyltransferase